MTFTNAVGWALIHYLWQGTAVALLLALVLRLLRGRHAAVRYACATVALFLLPVLVGGTVAREIRSDSARIIPTASAEAPAARIVTIAKIPTPAPARAESSAPAAPEVPGWRARLVPMLPSMVLLWLAGVALLAASHLGSWRAARRLRRIGVGPAPEAWQQALERLARALGLARPVKLVVSSVARVPGVIGWIKPVVLVPAAAVAGLTPEQVELLLAHELAHVRRHDYLVNVLQCAVESLLFYHPATWWVSRAVRSEREHCCDDLAIATRGDAVAYVEALVAMERLRLPPMPAPALGALSGAPGSLLERVRRLLDPDSERELFPRWIAGAAVAAGLFAAGLGVRWAGAENGSEAPVSRVATKSASRAAEPAPPQEPNALAPDTVLRHPDPSAPLAERFSWALDRGRRARGFWIGYSIDPLWPGSGRSIYVGREIRLGGKSGGITISGRVVHIGSTDRFDVPGVSVLRVVGGRPDDVALLFRYGRDGQLERVQASTVALPVDFGRRPLVWLGSADDDESVGLVERLRRVDVAASSDARSDLVSAIGVHRTNGLVIPILTNILRGREPDETRASAAEWLGSHADPASVVAVMSAARTDRSSRVRQEAAEAVGGVELRVAFDSLVALARGDDDPEVRREAVEAMGRRSEEAAVSTLVALARNDPSGDVRREAVETLGEFEDHRGVAPLLDLARTLRDLDARREAVETIGEAAEPARAAEILERVAREDDQEEIAEEAVETLGELEGGAGLPAVERLLADHPNPGVRREAVEAYGEAAPPAQAATLLARLIDREKDEDVRAEILETLAELEHNAGLEALLAIAKSHPDRSVRNAAIEKLGEVDTDEARDALAKIIEH
jgi:beta-lactamase regulating signal transducer with metallopeptidase domain/HEAT repeat protein